MKLFRIAAFASFLPGLALAQTEADLETLFAAIDADGTGTVTAPEMVEERVQAYRAYLTDRYNDVVMKSDTDGDGALSLEEFKAMVAGYEAEKQAMNAQIRAQIEELDGEQE